MVLPCSIRAIIRISNQLEPPCVALLPIVEYGVAIQNRYSGRESAREKERVSENDASAAERQIQGN